MPDPTGAPVIVASPAPGGAPAAQVPLGNGAPPPAPGKEAPAPATSAFKIPDAYKDRGWAKGIDSDAKAWEMLDNSQKLIGERPAGIPKPDAPQADWDKFYDAMGRPKTPAEYQFELDPSLKIDPKFVDGTKAIMHKNGLTPAQAKGLQKDLDAFMIATAKERNIELQKQNTDFSDLATKTFGADRDKILERCKGLINEYVNPAFKEGLKTMSNENLILMASVLNGIHAKYIKTDGAPGSAPGGTAKSADDLRAQARELMNSDAYKNPMHPDNARVRTQISELYKLATSGK